MKDCIDACLEIIKLTKFNPKRKSALERIKLKYLVETDSNKDELTKYFGKISTNRKTPLKLKKFCTTRCNVHHIGFRRISKNYESLLES